MQREFIIQLSALPPSGKWEQLQVTAGLWNKGSPQKSGEIVLEQPVEASKIFCFTNPESTTYLIPSIVMEVAAIFVDTTTFLMPGTI
jgi:hypothetical protein